MKNGYTHRSKTRLLEGGGLNKAVPKRVSDFRWEPSGRKQLGTVSQDGKWKRNRDLFLFGGQVAEFLQSLRYPTSRLPTRRLPTSRWKCVSKIQLRTLDCCENFWNLDWRSVQLEQREGGNSDLPANSGTHGVKTHTHTRARVCARAQTRAHAHTQRRLKRKGSHLKGRREGCLGGSVGG